MPRFPYVTSDDQQGEIDARRLRRGDVVRISRDLRQPLTEGAGGVLRVRAGEIGEVTMSDSDGALRVRVLADVRGQGLRDVEIAPPPRSVAVVLDERDPRIGRVGLRVLRFAALTLARNGVDVFDRSLVAARLAPDLARVVRTTSDTSWSALLLGLEKTAESDWTEAEIDELLRLGLEEDEQSEDARGHALQERERARVQPLYESVLAGDVRWALEATAPLFEQLYERRPEPTDRSDVLEALRLLRADLEVAVPAAAYDDPTERGALLRMRQRLGGDIALLEKASDDEWRDAATWVARFREELAADLDDPIFAPTPPLATAPAPSRAPAPELESAPALMSEDDLGFELPPVAPAPAPSVPGVPVGVPYGHPAAGLSKVWARPGTRVYHRQEGRAGTVEYIHPDDRVEVTTDDGGRAVWDAMKLVIDFHEPTVKAVPPEALRAWKRERAQRRRTSGATTAAVATTLVPAVSRLQ